MTLYKGIQGFSVQNLSADPTDPNEGQLWYNSTSNVWKLTSATTAGAWASGGNLNTARAGLAGAGTQTAGLAFGGYTHHLLQEQQKNTMEHLGQVWKFRIRRRYNQVGRYTNSSFSFGGTDSIMLLQQKQKLMMAQVGQL
jgi:hypothetical protein